MATTYTQTVEVSVWKEHTCAACGQVYRYLFKRSMKGEGKSPEAAEAAAEKAVVRALEYEVDQQPCPGCGLFQPDMIAAQRSRRHWWTFWAGVPVYGLLLILVLADAMTYGTAGLLAAVTAAALTAAHVVIGLQNTNRDLEANRKLARRRVKDGDIWVPEDTSEPEESAEPLGTGIGPGHYVCYALLAASVLAFLLPVVLRTALGMRSNAGWYPEVAGPGDSAYVYFPEKISSIKGMWSGSPQVTVVNAGELGGPVAVTATSKNSSWGNTITAKSREKNSSSTLWARVQFPADPRLAGKTLQLQITMNVQYPAIMGARQWAPQSKTASHRATIEMSSPGAGTKYKMGFWLGFIGGCGLLFLGGGLLPVFSNAFRHKALPTTIHVPEGKRRRRRGDDEEDEEDEEEEDDRPRRRSRREDEDDRPRARRRYDEDEDEEEDDRPRRRSRRDDDEDYDRPRRRRRDEE